MRALLPILAGACTGTVIPPAHPCHSVETEVDVTPARESFGSMADGAALWCGIPPQGGAPYAPLRARVKGPDALFDGMMLEIVAADPDSGEELSYTEQQMRMTCANVGESAGYWVSSEIHIRYPGLTLEELDGRNASLSVRVQSLDDSVSIEDEWLVGLVQE